MVDSNGRESWVCFLTSSYLIAICCAFSSTKHSESNIMILVEVKRACQRSFSDLVKLNWSCMFMWIHFIATFWSVTPQEFLKICFYQFNSNSGQALHILQIKACHMAVIIIQNDQWDFVFRLLDSDWLHYAESDGDEAHTKKQMQLQARKREKGSKDTGT